VLFSFEKPEGDSRQGLSPKRGASILSLIRPRLAFSGCLPVTRKCLLSSVLKSNDTLALHPGLESLRQELHFKAMLEGFCKDYGNTVQVLAQPPSRGRLPRHLEAPFADLQMKLNIKGQDVTQVVDGVKGVHVMLPKAIFAGVP
jgi:hypothetical protein